MILLNPIRTIIRPKRHDTNRIHCPKIALIAPICAARAWTTIQQRKARDAKSLLGKDIRPRTSEPRLRIAGVTSELDVLKTILVRER